MYVSIVYLGDTFKIYNGPYQPSILLDADFFITPLEEGIQTVKFRDTFETSSDLLSYNYNDSGFETVTSLPRTINFNAILRYTFNYTTATDQFVGVEVRMRSGRPLVMWLNDITIINSPKNISSDHTQWVRFLLPATFLVEGRNVLSLRLANDDFSFDCKARLLRSMFFSDRWEKPSSMNDIELFEASKLKPYTFRPVWGSKTVDYSFDHNSVVALTQFCLIARDLASLTPRFQLGRKNPYQSLVFFDTDAYTSVITGPDRSIYCYNLNTPVFANSFTCTFRVDSYGSKSYEVMGILHNSHSVMREESNRYPTTTFDRVTTRTCVFPYSAESILDFSLLDSEYQKAVDSVGVTVNSTSGELCVDIGVSESVDLYVGVFGSLGYKYVPITVIRSMRDCLVNSTTLIHETERVYDGECSDGYTGPMYQVCENGTFVPSWSDCIRIPPSPFSYSVSPVYYVSQEITLSPNTTYNVDSFSVRPSLPSGLVLNERTGVISGAPQGPNGTFPLTVTAMNDGGIAETSLTLTLLYLSCNYNGAFIPSGNRVYTRACVGGTGSVYLVCNNGVMSSEQTDECSEPLPFAYTVASVYYIGEELSLSPNATYEGLTYGVQPSLPSGLNLDSFTGVISGTPQGPNGTYPLTVTATNDGGVAEAFFTLDILYPPCEYNDELIPSGDRVYTRNCVGSTEQVYRVCENGELSVEYLDECSEPSPFAYSPSPVYYIGEELSLTPNTTYNGISYGVQPSLPSGLGLNPSTGVITGTPQGPNETYLLTVTATNDGGEAATSFTLTILYPPCSYEDASIPSGDRVYTRNCVGSTEQVYRVCENGELSVEYLDECSEPSPFAYSPSPVYYIGEELSLTPNTTYNGISYGVQPSLPSGLGLNPSTGVISGTPSGPNETYLLTVTATNDGGEAATSFTLNILYPPCSYNDASIPSGDRVYTRDCIGSSGRVYRVCENGVLSSENVEECSEPSPFAFTLSSFVTASGELTLTPVFTDANVGVSFSVQPSLPAGLSLDSATGVITGSSDVTGTYPLTVTASNDGGETTTTFALALASSLVAPDAPVFLVVYGCPAGYAGHRLHFSQEFDSDLTGGCSFQFADSFLYHTKPVYTLFVPMRVELNHAEVFDTFSISPALPAGVSFDNTTGLVEGVWREPDNRTFTISATSSIDVQRVTLSLSFQYPMCKGENGAEMSFGEEWSVKCFAWSFIGLKNQKCVVGNDGVVLEDLPNSCVGMHAGIFGAVLLVCVVIIIVVLMAMSLHPKVKVTIGDVYVLRVCSLTLFSSFCAMAL